ncbi:four helix bundle protein [Muricauda sp. SCSIO 64092]|uniref:four helix bundle protein n=1 Tax=Allomuricauda sp. SCSIO 64092 TaxID=2908842 RepID=UPI001FF60604|nr:four helix bundle protein [Muricauda sp. SCSIO 64092]UOY05681.1 four helix bundle protein [Muricauda sp. SCSIO 64092]
MDRSKNIIQQRTFALALRVIQLVEYLEKEEREYVLSKQLMRSGTAVGALFREAEHVESKKDFIPKMSISLKEANETKYSLDLLAESGLVTKEGLTQLQEDGIEVIKILVSIVKSSKNNV